MLLLGACMLVCSRFSGPDERSPCGRSAFLDCAMDGRHGGSQRYLQVGDTFLDPDEDSQLEIEPPRHWRPERSRSPIEVISGRELDTASAAASHTSDAAPMMTTRKPALRRVAPHTQPVMRRDAPQGQRVTPPQRVTPQATMRGAPPYQSAAPANGARAKQAESNSLQWQDTEEEQPAASALQVTSHSQSHLRSGQLVILHERDACCLRCHGTDCVNASQVCDCTCHKFFQWVGYEDRQRHRLDPDFLRLQGRRW